MRPTQREKPSSLFAAFYERMGRKMSKELVDEVMARPRFKPALSVSTALAYVMATVVHLITVIIAVMGVVLLIIAWPNIVLLVLALICLGIAWVMRPRFRRMPAEVLSHDEAPALYSVVNRVAEVLGSPPIDGIVFNPGFNAAYSQHGLSQKRVLSIGLPLFSILSGAEKIAVIAHELAHGVNGDPQRGYFINSALESLLHWAYIVRPHHIWDPAGSILNTVVMVPANFVLLGLSNLLVFAAYGLLHLLYRDSQRAEYLADYLAATVGGSSHMLSALEKFYSADHLQAVTQRFVLGSREGDLFVTMQQAVSELPERERERLRRVHLIEQARLDTSHPPTAYRVALLRAVATIDPQVMLDAQE